MKNLEKAYEYIDKYRMEKKIDVQERWQRLFILICDLIDNLGSYKKEYRNEILQMLNEYDFEKNRGE